MLIDPTGKLGAAAGSPLGTLLPTVNLLRGVGIPLLVFVVFAALLVGVVIRGVAQFRRSRKTE